MTIRLRCGVGLATHPSAADDPDRYFLHMGLFSVVAARSTPTNARLGVVLTPGQAVTRLRPGDVALGRLDVLPSLDGIEPGWWALETLDRRGVIVLNDGPSLARAHDKLATARALAAAGVSHPRTVHVAPWLPWPELEPPVVLKPRFGSWGRDVVRCETSRRSRSRSRRLGARVWFNSTGGVVQQLVPPSGYDLRLLVAGGRVVGAVSRHRRGRASGGRTSRSAPAASPWCRRPRRSCSRSPRPRRSAATSSASTSCRPPAAAGPCSR